MEQALYGPEGYYSSGMAKSGRQGDYFTASDVGPIFGRLLAAIFLEWQRRLNLNPFYLVEVGAGEGTLAQSVIESLRSSKSSAASSSSETQNRFRYVAIERSPARRARLETHDETLSMHGIFPDLTPLHKNPVSGCIFANELLDAFPVHRVRKYDGKLQEAYVVEDKNRYRFIWKKPSTNRLQAYLDRLEIDLPENYETEINLAMDDWIQQAAKSLSTGLVLIIDYGRPAQDYYAPERQRGTLRAFQHHRVYSDVLSIKGFSDLTADVDFTSLAMDAQEGGLTPLAFMELSSFLLEGVKQLATQNRIDPKETRPLTYLMHPDGLGAAFHVLILGKEIDPQEWIFEHNRLSRLGLNRQNKLNEEVRSIC